MEQIMDQPSNPQPENSGGSSLRLTEKNFRDLAHSSPDAIFVYVDEKIIFANNTGLKLLRAESAEEVIGRDVWDFVPVESHKSLKRAIDLVINYKKSYISTEDKIITTDGRTIDIEISSTYFNFNGRNGIQAFIRDISKRKKAEEKLKSSEKDYKIIFESTGTAMLFLEEDKTISLINGECEKISGYTKDEIEGKKKWTEFVAPEDRMLLEINHVGRRKNDIAPMNFEFKLIDKFRRYHNAFMTITMIPGTKKSVASIIDLTDIKKAEEILAATQQNYRLLVENTKEAIAIIQDEMVRYVNPKLCEITGYTENQILNKKFYKLVHSDFNEIVRSEYRHRLDGTESNTISPVKIIDTGKNERWFQINSVLTFWGEKPAVLLFFTDVTETKNAQDALMASEEKYRLLAENAKDIIIVYDENGSVNYLNTSGYETFGISKDKKNEINVADILFPGSEYLTPSALIGESSKDLKNYKNRIEVSNFLGEMIQLETISSPIKLDSDNYGMLVIGRDITERKQLEREIILISERIRQQVSRDLHDDLNPHLIGIEALSQVLFMSLKKKEIPESADAEKIAALINKAITKTHRLARGLCPIDLESSGIQTPLMSLIKLIRSLYGIDCKFNYDESIIIEDITLATNLYYIAQEATLNSAKYSGGSLITITLKRSSETLTLTIEDNGAGIQKVKGADNDKSGGMGLKIMKYRAEIIDGVFSVQKNKPSGTAISVKIPINILKSEGRISYGGRFPKTKPETADLYS
jgi:PAS domain S-box-containing protein